jgi:hypothetical protein
MIDSVYIYIYLVVHLRHETGDLEFNLSEEKIEALKKLVRSNYAKLVDLYSLYSRPS